jgi:hypothetical protein
MTNMNVEKFKLKIYYIKFWILIFKEDVWIWIGVALDCG